MFFKKSYLKKNLEIVIFKNIKENNELTPNLNQLRK